MNQVSKNDMSNLPYIIAVDFDGTLVEDNFPEIGNPIERVWDMVHEAQAFGNKVILWTCRDHENLSEAVEFCKSHGLVFDAVNENVAEIKALFNNDTRKIFADEYWDDKSRGICGERMGVWMGVDYGT